MHSSQLRALFLIALTPLAACRAREGYIDTDDAPRLVDAERFSTAAAEQVIGEVVGDLLNDHIAAYGPSHPKATVAVLGVDNQSSDTLGDSLRQIHDVLDNEINQSDRFGTVSERYLSAGLRETNLYPDDLFIPAKRRAFAQVMETGGNPVELLVFPKLTSSTATSGIRKQKKYILTLDVVSTADGFNHKYDADISKTYVKNE